MDPEGTKDKMQKAAVKTASTQIHITHKAAESRAVFAYSVFADQLDTISETICHQFKLIKRN